MSDRNSAEILGAVFEMLAKDPTEQHKAMAAKLWPMTQRFDFSDDQLCCDKALEKLGLLRWEPDPEHPDEEFPIYGPTRSKRGK